MQETKTISDEDIRQFFSKHENYVGIAMSQIFHAIGKPTETDDWDWGRLVYDWQRPTLRYQLVTRGGHVICAEELDPNDTSRFGKTLRVLWGDSSP
jgi:hypothetical protein